MKQFPDTIEDVQEDYRRLQDQLSKVQRELEVEKDKLRRTREVMNQVVTILDVQRKQPIPDVVVLRHLAAILKGAAQ